MKSTSTSRMTVTVIPGAPVSTWMAAPSVSAVSRRVTSSTSTSARMLVGAAAAAINANLNVSEQIRHAGDAIVPGFGAVLLVLALAGLITITGLSFYGGSLTLLSIADSVRPIRHTRGERTVSLLAREVVATVVSGGSYLLFCRSLDLPAERAAIATADAGMEAGDDGEPGPV